MKITCISDTHGQHRKLKLDGGDILIHAGDIEANIQHDLINFCDWFYQLPYKYKIFIGGNHDFYLQDHPIRAEEVIENFDIIYLQDDGIIIEDHVVEEKNDYLKIWGSPWSKKFLDWAFMKEQEELIEHYKNIPDDIDIIISHSPPHGYQDRVYGENVGVKGLPLEKKTIICGHIHEGYGWRKTETLDVINCSVLDENYKLVNEPIEFEI